MMEYYTSFVDPPMQSYSKKSKKFYSDNIYTFDIETTSLFDFGNGWEHAKYDDDIDYKEVPRAAVPYIWMFGVNGKRYYGREFYDFEKILISISDPLYRKVIWIQNLAFEFGYLPDIINKYTVEAMIAREKRKPIQFYVRELNIVFRCSYMLTNMSLENAAKEYTNVEKKTGDLDYNKLRSPLTRLTETEMGYCEYDIICLEKIIEYYLKKYNGIAKIPLTSTSTVRHAIKKVVDFAYIKHQQELVPPVDMYLRFWWAFAGGYTHANVINASRVIKGVIHSKDIASSYPTVMVTEKFPSQPFRKATPKEFLEGKKRDKYCYLLKVRFEGLESRYYNHYLQYEKVKVNVVNPVTDNGRVVSCDSCEYYLTDVDYDIMMVNYHAEKVTILECYKSFKKYLDIRIIKFILDLYCKKTTLKGFTSDDPEEVERVEAIYRAAKALLNGIYGMSVTSILHQAEYEDHEWTIPATLDPDNPENAGLTTSHMFANFCSEKLEESKKSFSTLFFYPVGIWVTSYARRNLVMRIFSSHDFDRDMIYTDTDSLKYTGDYNHIFDEYNKSVYNKYCEVVREFPTDLKISDFMPKDRKGIAHPIGYYEDDGTYTEFITHGAKKYCYRSAEDGKLHITVSGVSKKGVSALNDDINNFKKDFRWSYRDSGKLTHDYVDNQADFTFTDIDGNEYTSHQRHAVILYPATYTLGITGIYELLIEYFRLGKMRRYER